MKNLLLLIFFIPVFSFSQLLYKEDGSIDFSKKTTIIKKSKTIIHNNNTDIIRPEYKTGRNDLIKFISSNFKYPKQKQAGEIRLSFDVDSKANLSNFEFIKNLNPDYDNELLRVIKLTEKNWIPGKEKNITKKMNYTFTINFKK